MEFNTDGSNIIDDNAKKENNKKLRDMAEALLPRPPLPFASNFPKESDTTLYQMKEANKKLTEMCLLLTEILEK